MENDKLNCSSFVQQTYTVEQIAKILGISQRKAYNFCESTSDFRTMRLGRRCLRVHKASFDHWLSHSS